MSSLWAVSGLIYSSRSGIMLEKRAHTCVYAIGRFLEMNENPALANQRIRYDNIDLLEFFGMLLVIMYHSPTIPFDIIGAPSALAYVNYFLRPILSTCVPLFFFANGFLLINRHFDLKKHIEKTINLIFLTVMWGIITLFLLMCITGQRLSLEELMTGLLEWKQGWINHLWYMGALVCIYFAFPLIKAAFDHEKKIFDFCVIVCLIFGFGNTFLSMAATVLSCFAGGETYVSYNFFNMFNPLRGLYGHTFAYFCIGCWVGGNQALVQEKVRQWKFINPGNLVLIIVCSSALLGAWGLLGSRLTGRMWDTVWNGYDTVFTAVNVLALHQLSLYYQNTGGRVCKLIRAVSGNTLGIYFIHIIIVRFLGSLGVAALPFMKYFAVNVIYAFGIMLLSLLITLLLKRIPGIKGFVTL